MEAKPAEQQRNRSKRGKRGSDVGEIALNKGNPGVEARGEEQSGIAETTGDGRDGKPRQIDAKGGNWVYNADRLGAQKGNAGLLSFPKDVMANSPGFYTFQTEVFE